MGGTPFQNRSVTDFDSDLAEIAREYVRRKSTGEGCYSFAKPANLLFDIQATRSCIKLLTDAGLYPLTNLRILDVGCGTGGWLLQFLRWGAEPSLLSGIDLQQDRIDSARLKMPTSDLHTGSASDLPWPDKTFDLVSQFTVFTSVLNPALKMAIAHEIRRVVKPNGALLWFDFRVNNPYNRAVRAVTKPDIESLFPLWNIRLESVVLAPPLARLIVPFSWSAAELLHLIPCLRTHYVGLLRKPL